MHFYSTEEDVETNIKLLLAAQNVEFVGPMPVQDVPSDNPETKFQMEDC